MSLYAIIGHSASGKTTIERMLENGYQIPRIISYTTRPIRLGEINGNHYHFIDEDTFYEMDKDGKFTETAQYRDWHYALSLEGIDYKNKDYIAVVTPHGYNEVVEAIGKEHVVSLFINVKERRRMIRLANRGDDIDEIIRRIEADRIDFDGFVKKADFIIENEDLDKTVEFIYTLIKSYNKHSNK